MFAVIETGGKQYRVSEGDIITIEKRRAEDGERIEFDKVLTFGEGADIQIGTPYLDAARVFGSVVESGKGKKVVIFKYKAKKDYRKKQGHRQPYTMVQIDGMSADGSTPIKKEAPKKTESVSASEMADAKVEETAPSVELGDEKPSVTTVAAEKVTEKKPAAKKAVAEKGEAEKKITAEKKTAVKKTEEEKKPAIKKAPAKKAEAKDKPEE